MAHGVSSRAPSVEGAHGVEEHHVCGPGVETFAIEARRILGWRRRTSRHEPWNTLGMYLCTMSSHDCNARIRSTSRARRPHGSDMFGLSLSFQSHEYS